MTGRDAPHSRLSPAKHARSAASVSAPARQFVGPAPPPRLATIRVTAFSSRTGSRSRRSRRPRHDPLRRDEAPARARAGGPRDDSEARPREAPLPEPRPDPAHPRQVGEQVRRAVGGDAHGPKKTLEEEVRAQNAHGFETEPAPVHRRIEEGDRGWQKRIIVSSSEYRWAKPITRSSSITGVVGAALQVGESHRPGPATSASPRVGIESLGCGRDASERMGQAAPHDQSPPRCRPSSRRRSRVWRSPGATTCRLCDPGRCCTADCPVARRQSNWAHRRRPPNRSTTDPCASARRPFSARERARRQREGRASASGPGRCRLGPPHFARQAREAECGRAQGGFGPARAAGCWSRARFPGSALPLASRAESAGSRQQPVARGHPPRPPPSGGRQRPQRVVDRDVLGSPRCRCGASSRSSGRLSSRCLRPQEAQRFDR
jgi:hypothetical protein